MVERSAVADHAWSEHHRIDWNQVRVIDCVNKRIELLIKEALHIAMIPDGACLNRDKGLELPDCWLSTIRTLQKKIRIKISLTLIKILRMLRICLYSYFFILYHSVLFSIFIPLMMARTN